jgi:hypothetical protein
MNNNRKFMLVRADVPPADPAAKTLEAPTMLTQNGPSANRTPAGPFPVPFRPEALSNDSTVHGKVPTIDSHLLTIGSPKM